MEYCDLHTHSTYSDGTFSPAQIVAEGLRKKLRAVALTDHNTVAGLPAFLKAAEGTGLEGILGVEISTGYRNQEVHIVGLFLRQESYGELEDFLSVINQRKEKSNRELVAALREAGYALNYSAASSMLTHLSFPISDISAPPNNQNTLILLYYSKFWFDF